MMRALKRLSLLLLVLSLLPTAGCGEKREAHIATTVRDARVKPPVEEPAPELISTQQAFIEVSAKVTPAVVNIRAARARRGGDLGPLFEDFFGDLFRNQPRRLPPEQSLGSGFILSEDGYILTNEHVVKGAEQIKVKLSDQRIFDAEVVGVDDRTDVAVLKIEPDDGLPTVVLGDSDALQVGQWALAIGNPFGLDRTLTVGVISGTGRSNVGIEEYEDFIQTDASINPGKSGGPLLNIYGEVIGINTAIVASGQGIGFAIPINLARLIADQLMATGSVTRGWLGVGILEVTPELAESFDLGRTTGALVNQVMEGTPAAEGGLQQGDIILTFEGKEVRGVRELQLMVASSPAGREVVLEILREGRRRSLTVTLGQRPVAGDEAPAGTEPVQEELLGLAVAPTSEGRGVQVTKVVPGSAAENAGVREGDVILALNQKEVNELTAYRAAAREAQRTGRALLLLQRGESTLYLAFTLN